MSRVRRISREHETADAKHDKLYISAEMEQALDFFERGCMEKAPGYEIRVTGGSFKRGDLGQVAAWIEKCDAVNGNHYERVPVGMLNGLLTRMSDFPGARALRMMERLLKALGFAVAAIGTNDDSHALLAVPANANALAMSIDAMMAALRVATTVFGIEVNLGKANVSSLTAELNTNLIITKTNGDLSAMLPAERSNLGAVGRVPQADCIAGALDVLSSSTPGLKEGGTLCEAYATQALNQLKHWKVTKLDTIALATSVGDRPPDGFPELGRACVAPHLYGLPVMRPYLGVFPASAQVAAIICHRLLKLNTTDGTYATIKRTMEADLILEVCKQVAANAIAMNMKVLGDFSFKSIFPEQDLSYGTGPFTAVPKKVALRLERKEPLFKDDFFTSLDIIAASAGGKAARGTVAWSVLRAAANEVNGDPLRAKNTIYQSSMLLWGLGGVPKAKGGVPAATWRADKDTSDLPKRFIINRPHFAEDGSVKNVRGKVSAWWLWESWNRYDWDRKVVVATKMLDLMVDGMRNHVNAILKLLRRLETEDHIISIGHRYTMYRSDMSTFTARPFLPPLVLAALLDPDPVRGAALEFNSLVTKKVAGDVILSDLTQLGKGGRPASIADINEIKLVAAGLALHTNGHDLRGYILPKMLPKPTYIDAASHLALGILGMSCTVKKPLLIPMPVPIANNVNMSLSPEATEVEANSCIVAFLEAREMEVSRDENTIEGILPTPAEGSNQTFNSLISTSFPAAMVGLRMAAARGLVLKTDETDYRVLASATENKEGMYYIHAAPGVAVKGVKGVHFKKGAVTHWSRVIHTASTVECSVRKERVMVGGQMDTLYRYVYKHHVFTHLTKRQGEELHLVLNYKMKGKKKLHTFEPERIASNAPLQVGGNPVEIHWEASLHATVRGYPPYYCLGDADGHIIPISPVDPRASISTTEFERRTPTPADGFGYSHKDYRPAAKEQLFVTDAVDLARSPGGVTINEAIMGALRFMTPWEVVRCYVTSIMNHIGYLKVGWSFSAGQAAEDIEELKALDRDKLADRLIGGTALLEQAYRARASNISTLFFETGMVKSVEQAVASQRIDFRGEGDDVPEALDAFPSIPQKYIEHRFRSSEPAADLRVVLPKGMVDEPEEEEKHAGREPTEDDVNAQVDMMMMLTMDPEAAEEEGLYNGLERESERKTEVGSEHSSERVLKAVRELDGSKGDMDADAFVVREGEFFEHEDLDELDFMGNPEIRQIAAAMPLMVLEAKRHTYHLQNLNTTATAALGLLIGKAASQRGAQGGGYAVWRPKEMYGTKGVVYEQEGVKWMRVPLTAWTGMVLENHTFSHILDTYVKGYFDSLEPSLPGNVSVTGSASGTVSDTSSVAAVTSDFKSYSSAYYKIAEHAALVGNTELRLGKATYQPAVKDPDREAAKKALMHLRRKSDDIKEEMR